MKVTDKSLTLPAPQAIEYLVNQDKFTKQIFADFGDFPVHMGIGCACSQGKNIDETTCYFVTAHHVIGKDIQDRIPTY